MATKGSCQVEKVQNPRKTEVCVCGGGGGGGQAPTRILNNFVFFCIWFRKKSIGGGWVWSATPFFQLNKTPNHANVPSQFQHKYCAGHNYTFHKNKWKHTLAKVTRCN